MAVYRQVSINFWQDAFVLSLTPEEKYFYLYLMTNSKSSLSGIYELPYKIIEIETGYNRETVEKLITKFEKYGKIAYSRENSEIMLLNWIKHNKPSSPKTLARVKKELEEIKTKEFVDMYVQLVKNLYGIDVEIEYRYSMDRVSIEYPYSMDTETQKEKEKEYKYKKEYKKEKKKIEKEKEKSDDFLSSVEDPPFKSIVAMFNRTCKSYPPIKQLTDKRKKHIRARYAKHPLDEILTVFRKMEASSFLKGDNNRGWQASFDWVIKNEDNFIKVLEGRYDDGAKRSRGESDWVERYKNPVGESTYSDEEIQQLVEKA